MMAAPVFFIGMPLLILLVLGLVFLVVRFGKDRPGAVGWIVGGFVLLMMGGVFLPVMARSHIGPADMKVRMLPLLLIGLIIGVVIVFVKGGRGVRIGIGVLAGLVLLMLPLLALFAVRMEAAHDVAWEGTMPTRGEPAIWHDGVVDQYAADVYPSKRSAARALGIRLAAALDEVLAGRRRTTRIVFVGDDANPGLIDVVAEGYASRGGTWTVTSPGQTRGDDVTVNLESVDGPSAVPPWSAGDSTGDWLDSGTLTATVHLVDGASTTVSAVFLGKPWVENIAAFLGRDPRRQFVLGRSDRSCTSPEEAREQAISAACSAVSGILRRTQGQPLLKVELGVNEADLNSAGLIVDRFAQRLSGTMASPIWREAVLVDVSEEKVAALAERKVAAARQQRTSWAKMALTLGGMFALICVVYVFLNAATRGYYTWALRVAVVVLMGAGVFFLLLLS